MRLPLPISLRGGSDAVSPTAHYTGHVWARNGLSHPELETFEGRLLFGALAPAMTASRELGGPTLEGLLLARHRIIDAQLTEAIDAGRIGQVLEIACGMSPRGWRFVERYGDRLTYVEADLPPMAARKRRALERIGSLGKRHRVVDIDALADRGPTSIGAVTATLDRELGLAVVTEGLLTYFPEDAVRGMWRRIAAALREFPAGLYLADARIGGGGRPLIEHAFGTVLSSFVRQRVHIHFGGQEEAAAALRAAGFDEARLRRADRVPAAGDAGRDPGAAGVHIIEAGV